MNPFATTTTSTSANGSGSSRRITMVPLERELETPAKQKEILDKLSDYNTLLQQLMRGGGDRNVFDAYGSVGKALQAATEIVKTFRA